MPSLLQDPLTKLTGPDREAFRSLSEVFQLAIEPLLRVSQTDLNALLSTLEISVVSLSECLVSRGSRLDMGAASVTGLHYNLKGKGKMFVEGQPPVQLQPHTLVILPAHSSFRIETAVNPRGSTLLSGTKPPIADTSGPINRFVSGDNEPEVVLICGFFHAFYGSSVDIFASLNAPIIEQFDESDRLDETLKVALSELINQEIGSGAMSAAVLKQVVITILRRSLTSMNLWVERFAMLRDAQISRAFAEMAAHPGSNHTIFSLADTACLSRSSFMARFTEIIGDSPMNILRQLRMRQAARHLTSGHASVDQIARSAGYESKSSFIKAFKRTFQDDPSEYRARVRTERFGKEVASQCHGTMVDTEELQIGEMTIANESA